MNYVYFFHRIFILEKFGFDSIEYSGKKINEDFRLHTEKKIKGNSDVNDREFL